MLYQFRLHHFKSVSTAATFHICCLLKSKNDIKKIVFKPDGDQFLMSQKMASLLCPLPSLSIKISNGNRIYGPKSNQSLILSSFIVRSYLLRWSPCCVTALWYAHILEINLTKRQTVYEWFYSIVMVLSKQNRC